VTAPKRPVWSPDADFADWLYTWGNLPMTLEGLRTWLAQRNLTPEQFKQSARYQANLQRFPWLKEL
jgi:hypothetical protein